MPIDTQEHLRETKETLGKTTICRNYLCSSFTWQNMVQFHWAANLITSCKWLELTAAAPLDDSWLHAIKEDGLNHKPFFISVRLFHHSSWDFFNLLLLHPNLLFGSWLRTTYHFIFTHSQPTLICRGVAKITICKWN